jgi:hypothetical protein
MGPPDRDGRRVPNSSAAIRASSGFTPFIALTGLARSVSQAAELWGCSSESVRKLIRTGVLGAQQRRVRRVVPATVVQQLADRRQAPLGDLVSAGLAHSSTIAVLRPNVIRDVAEQDRTSIGFHATTPAATLLDGLRGWWRCSPESVAAGGILPVTCCGFVVAVLGGLTNDGWEFAADEVHKGLTVQAFVRAGATVRGGRRRPRFAVEPFDLRGDVVIGLGMMIADDTLPDEASVVTAVETPTVKGIDVSDAKPAAPPQQHLLERGIVQRVSQHCDVTFG